MDLNKLIGRVKAMKVSGGADDLDDLKDAVGQVDLRALEGLKNEGVKEN